MPAFQLATSRMSFNPVRVQQWNVSIRAGDDFSLALSCYDDDDGTVTDLTGSASALALFRDDASYDGHAWGYGCDYGWGWFTLRRQPEAVIAGVNAVTPGLINFVIPAATTAGFWGRYRIALQVGTSEGLYTQVEGILQTRRGLGAGLLSGALAPGTPGAAGVAVSLAYIITGRPAALQKYNLVPGVPLSVPANFAGTAVYAGTPAAANAVFTLNRISAGGTVTTAIGTVTVLAGTTEGCALSSQPACALLPGDVLQLVAPATQDATLADVGLTILALR